MDTFNAFYMGEKHRNDPVKVFDWIKAAEIIRDEKPDEVEAGLSGDWEWTGGVIYRDGQIVTDSYTYLASVWATPQILIDGCHRDCFVMKSDTKWDSGTKWPEEARAILAKKRKVQA